MGGPRRGAAPTAADEERRHGHPRHREVRMAADDEARRPDPAGAAARSMTHLAQQMRDMAERMLSGGLPGWPVSGALGTGTTSGSGGTPTGNGPATTDSRSGSGAASGGPRPVMPG